MRLGKLLEERNLLNLGDIAVAGRVSHVSLYWETGSPHLILRLVDSELVPKLVEGRLLRCMHAHATVPRCAILRTFRTRVGLYSVIVERFPLLPGRSRLQNSLPKFNNGLFGRNIWRHDSASQYTFCTVMSYLKSW